MRKQNRGSATLLSLGLLLTLLLLVLLILEMGSSMESYDYAVDVLQRCCNSAVEGSLIDAYRADRQLVMDCEKAKLLFQSYLGTDLPSKYTVKIQSISCSSAPPTMSVRGTVTFPTMFRQYGFRSLTCHFTVQATNYDLD